MAENKDADGVTPLVKIYETQQDILNIFERLFAYFIIFRLFVVKFMHIFYIETRVPDFRLDSGFKPLPCSSL